jgi:hypothetical protein
LLLRLRRVKVRELLKVRNMVLRLIETVVSRVGLLVSDAIDCIILLNDALHFLKGDIVTLDASFTGELLPIRRVTATGLVALLHHGTIVLIDFDFLLLVHDDFRSSQQLDYKLSITGVFLYMQP